MRLRAPRLGALALVLACVGGASAYATVAQGGGDSATVPTLPPLEERAPDLYDDEGCLRVEAGEVDCTTTAGEVDDALADDVGTRHLAGYVGDHYSEELSGDVVVLEDTVSRATDGPFAASGLVRNERTAAVGAVEVSAHLLDAGGSELAVASAPVPVAPLRPGEPAPFEVQSEVAAASVAAVTWTVSAAPAEDARPPSREIELTTYWEEPGGAREPVHLYFYDDPATAPLPYLLFGGLSNRAGVDVGPPRVVAAWLDEAGRVVRVDSVDAVAPDGSASAGLDEDGVADFLLVEDTPAGAPGVAVELWGVS